MSGRLAGKVWASGLDGSLKPLAASLADMVNDHGDGIEAGLPYLSWRLSRSRSTVQEQLGKLRALEVIRPTCHEHCKNEPGRGHGRRQPVTYHFEETKLPSRQPWAEYHEEQLAKLRKSPETEPIPGPDEPQNRALSVVEKGPVSPSKGPGLGTERARFPGTDPDPETVQETAPSPPNPPSLTSEQQDVLGHLHAEIRRLIYGGTSSPPEGWCDDLARRGMTSRDADEAIQAALAADARREAYVRRVLERYVADREKGTDPHESRSRDLDQGEGRGARRRAGAGGGGSAARPASGGRSRSGAIPRARRPGRTDTGDDFDDWRAGNTESRATVGASDG